MVMADTFCSLVERGSDKNKQTAAQNGPADDGVWSRLGRIALGAFKNGPAGIADALENEIHSPVEQHIVEEHRRLQAAVREAQKNSAADKLKTLKVPDRK